MKICYFSMSQNKHTNSTRDIHQVGCVVVMMESVACRRGQALFVDTKPVREFHGSALLRTLLALSGAEI